jgi:hypothetical protein
MTLLTITKPRVMTTKEESSYIGMLVGERDANISEPCRIEDEDGNAILVYAPFPGDITEFRNAILPIPMGITTRSIGTYNASRTFGKSSKRVVMQREGCRDTSLSMEMPDQHQVLVDTAELLKQELETHVPGQVAKDLEATADITDEWRMAPGALWSSGVINYSSALPYHKDRNNFPAWSAMPVIRRGVRGGFLHIPAYDITLSCQDGMVAYFPGHLVTHGVTPMKRVKPDGYRYSVVYYALKGMKDCATAAMETAEARKRRTAREELMAEKARQALAGTD